MKKTGRVDRLVPELYDILDMRAKRFKTSRAEEQRNLVSIVREFEHSLGFDISEVPVIEKKKPILKFSKKLFTVR